jgi:hypothetical protein
MPPTPGLTSSNSSGVTAQQRMRVTNPSGEEGNQPGGTNLSSIPVLGIRLPADFCPDLTDRDSLAELDATTHAMTMTSSGPVAPPPASSAAYLRQNQLSSNDAYNSPSKPNFTSRRRQSSIPKIPMGPRPFENGAGKRFVQPLSIFSTWFALLRVCWLTPSLTDR